MKEEYINWQKFIEDSIYERGTNKFYIIENYIMSILNRAKPHYKLF